MRGKETWKVCDRKRNKEREEGRRWRIREGMVKGRRLAKETKRSRNRTTKKIKKKRKRKYIYKNNNNKKSAKNIKRNEKKRKDFSL